MGAVIVDAVRTCAGVRGGALRNWHAVDLLAFSYEGLLGRIDLDPELIDGVVATCRTTVGEQAFNVGRGAVLASGWPQTVSAVSIEGAAGAGISALQYATGLIASGTARAIIVSGVETPSRVVAGSSIGIGTGKPFGPRVHERFANDGGLPAPGVVAERMAERANLGRESLDEWAAQSHERAAAARRAGKNKAYWLPVPLRSDRATELDPSLQFDELLDQPVDLPEFKPLFEPGGNVTAGNMAQPVDASAALLVTSDEFAAHNDLAPLARVVGVVTRGCDALVGENGVRVAREMCDGELPELISVHEDFASTPIAFMKEAKVDVNRSGGAIAFGDMGGAAAAAILVELAHEVSSRVTTGLGVVAGTGDVAGAALLAPPD